MNQSSPYLNPKRLPDVIAALQFLGSYKDYKLTAEEWTSKMKSQPLSATGSWQIVFAEHPEFFRESDFGISLVWRRTLRHDEDDRRPALDPKEVGTLIDTAIRLCQAAVEERREQRWWLPILVAAVAFLGALSGALIKAM